MSSKLFSKVTSLLSRFVGLVWGTRAESTTVPSRRKNQVKQPFLQIEPLETRQTPSVGWGWSGSTLRLIGDQGGVAANDSINVEIRSDRVWFSGTGLTEQSVPASSVGQIDIAGKGGNDYITVTQRERFDKLIQLFGDAGDDQMRLDIQSDSVGRYHADGGLYGRDTVVVPNRMPGGPSGFPKSLSTWDVE